MGTESDYIKLDVEDLKFSDSIKECFKQRYSVSEYKMSSGKLFKKSIVDDRRFVIDGKAIVTITKMQKNSDMPLAENQVYLHDRPCIPVLHPSAM